MRPFVAPVLVLCCSAVCSHAERRQGWSRCPPPSLPLSSLPCSSAIAVIYTGPFGCQRCSCTAQRESARTRGNLHVHMHSAADCKQENQASLTVTNRLTMDPVVPAAEGLTTAQASTTLVDEWAAPWGRMLPVCQDQ
ncbi:unnamed protein product [Pleuronectes platessa]|uniref:Secreted protein n=1 Tax=Pleuronectes platessa TaxID=8262 RepID=A0A9N7VZX2_PLEPL|nr:unnamed protein product [Pleuronectes platessa]